MQCVMFFLLVRFVEMVCLDRDCFKLKLSITVKMKLLELVQALMPRMEQEPTSPTSQYKRHRAAATLSGGIRGRRTRSAVQQFQKGEDASTLQAALRASADNRLVGRLRLDEEDSAAEFLGGVMNGGAARRRIAQQAQAAPVLQGAAQGSRIRTLMKNARTIVTPVERSVHGSHLVQHTWLQSGPLGVELAPWGIIPENPEGAVVTGVHAAQGLPEQIRPGLRLQEVNGVHVGNECYATMIDVIQASPRPLTLVFKATVEHVVLMLLEEQFLKADGDCSGSLNRSELAQVMKSVYRSGRLHLTSTQRLM